MGVFSRGGLFFLLSLAVARKLTSTLYSEDAVFDRNYTGLTRPNGGLTVYRYSVQQSDVVRIRMASMRANLSTPLLAVFRDYTTLISIQLPIVNKNYLYYWTARTLCPHTLNMDGNVSVSVELSSIRPIDFTFSATILDDFVISDNSPQLASASAFEPTFYQFNFPDNLDTVVVWIESNSSICMTVSIQKAECPVFDLDNNVISGGSHQTMTRSGSITVERRFYEKFFVVFVIRPNDDDCSTMAEIMPPHPRPIKPRKKIFTINIQKAPHISDYVLPISATFGVFSLIYILAIVFMISMGAYERRVMEREGRMLLSPTEEAESAPTSEYMADNMAFVQAEPSTSSALDLVESGSIDSTNSYDFLSDARDKLVVRMNLRLHVSDLSIKTWKQRDKKYNRYVVSILTVALFYGLPVVQLVLTWQQTVRTSGNLDLCWYNFRCARPFFVFFAFNNVISNIGYISLGLLLLFMVKEREMRHRSLCNLWPVMEDQYGLPQHNGLMYAIGLAVVMEGILSASYHICPSSSNYQFDTSFMYIIGLLGMLKIYQLRHPDINPNAHNSFAIAALFIFIAMIGVYLNTVLFWIFFALTYLVTMFLVSLEFYFKGLWRLNIWENIRSIQYTFHSSRWCSCLIPAYKSRFFFVVIGNAINLGMVTLGVIKRPKDFPSFLLGPFIANLFLYLLYYIIMKMVHREKLHGRALAFLLLSLCCWIAAGWFFLHSVSDWSETPAASRERNQDCILLAFYDNHDVWHFLSSIAIFLSFSLINYVDDDLRWTRRDRIAVF